MSPLYILLVTITLSFGVSAAVLVGVLRRKLAERPLKFDPVPGYFIVVVVPIVAAFVIGIYCDKGAQLVPRESWTWSGVSLGTIPGLVAGWGWLARVLMSPPPPPVVKIHKERKSQ